MITIRIIAQCALVLFFAVGVTVLIELLIGDVRVNVKEEEK